MEKCEGTGNHNTDTRYILPDEMPCQFCDMAIRGCCPYNGLSDEGKERRCRIYLYFMVLKAHEERKFDDAAEGEPVNLCECVYDIATMAQHLSEQGKIETEDSRELFGSIMAWAKEFEREHPGPWESREEEEDYIDAIDEFAEKKLLEKYGVLELAPKKLLDTPANLARSMIEDLGNGAMEGFDRWSSYFGLAVGKDEESQGQVMAALGEAKHDLPEDEWYYTLHIINDVDGTDCELHHTDHLREEELVALLEELMEKMEKGKM